MEHSRYEQTSNVIKALERCVEDLSAAFRDECCNPDGMKALIHSLRTLVKIDPGNIDNHIKLANIFIRLGDLEEAFEVTKSARLMSPKHFAVNFTMGRVLAEMGEYDNALSFFDKALEEKPSSPMINNAKGLALANGGYIHASVEFLAAAAASTAYENPGYYLDYIQAAAADGQLDHALELLQDIHADRVAHGEKDDPRAMYLMGKIYDNKGDEHSSCIYYAHAVSMDDSVDHKYAELSNDRLEQMSGKRLELTPTRRRPRSHHPNK